ncbi:hypothetical protein FKM82_004213 [Ascaphus truei]
MGETYKEGHHALLSEGEENEMDIFGYKTDICRKVLCMCGYICSLGFLLLLFYWKPEWDVWANCVPCSLHEADVVLLRTTVGIFRINLFHLFHQNPLVTLQITKMEKLTSDQCVHKPDTDPFTLELFYVLNKI